jgi:CBS domain containing-hemolysin-like protein
MDPDTGNIGGLIVALLLLLIGSAYFSATEAALMRCNRIRLKTMAGEGNKQAALVLKFTDNFDQVLSGILIGNNIVNILSASLATYLFTKLWGNWGVTISTIVMTVCVLIFGEICPKNIAKRFPEIFAMKTAWLLQLILWILTPLNWFFSPFYRLSSRIFKEAEDQSMTEDELITMIDEAEEGGDLDEGESDLIRSAIEFNDVTVEEILTRRVNMSAVEDDMSIEEVKQVFIDSGFSRLPVYHETIDNIIGILHEKDFMAHLLQGGTEYLSILQDVIYVPATIKISVLLQKLKAAQSHMALVIDEGGGIEGLVTMEDILEELVGEIWDEHDEVEEDFQRISEEEVLVTGQTDLEDLFEELEITADPDEFESTSVGGWTMEELGDVPNVGEGFDFEGYHFAVTQAEERRVLEIMATKLPSETEEEAPLK